MNRQVDHIVHAGILLSLMSGIIYFISSFSGRYPSSSNETPVVTETATESVKMTESAVKGKTLFMGKCASCHSIFKDGTGPALAGLTERGPWTERKNIYAWIRNPQKFMQPDEYTRELKKRFNTMMTAFPDLTNEEIDAMVDYINFVGTIKVTSVP